MVLPPLPEQTTPYSYMQWEIIQMCLRTRKSSIRNDSLLMLDPIRILMNMFHSAQDRETVSVSRDIQFEIFSDFQVCSVFFRTKICRSGTQNRHFQVGSNFQAISTRGAVQATACSDGHYSIGHRHLCDSQQTGIVIFLWGFCY